MFTLALLVLALAVMAVGGDSGWPFKKVDYYVAFPGADGLLVGAPVKMAGVTIGTVTEIRLPLDPVEQGIRARVSIDPDYAPRLRADSRAALRILQLLTNEKFVEVSPGREGELLEPGSEITLQVETGIVERGALIAEDMGEITVSLKHILAKLERGEGLLGQMLEDPEFGKKGLDALGQTLENTERITANLREGRGALGRLLNDESLAGTLDDFGRAVQDFATLMAAAGGEKGTMTELLADGGPAEQAVYELRDAAAALNRLVGRLEQGEGLLGRLMSDPEYSAALADDLSAVLRNVAEITDKINRGEGTLGALVNERVLHDGAEEVVAGVNDSKFARWLTRRYQKRGIEVEQAEQRERGEAGEGH
jgi:phospholipid/cholesterol/gamma-HCH transport system substrate-binding protein